jgi:hypothetical protein
MSTLDLSMVRAAPIKSVPKVTGAHPSGSLVLVELLTEQELTSSKIFVAEGSETGMCQQGYVLETGPSLPESSGIVVGQRVMLQGRGAVPVPNYDKSHREKNLVEVHMIKAILDEEQLFPSVVELDHETD